MSQSTKGVGAKNPETQQHGFDKVRFMALLNLSEQFIWCFGLTCKTVAELCSPTPPLTAKYQHWSKSSFYICNLYANLQNTPRSNPPEPLNVIIQTAE